jgi:hypothetical protein
VAAANLAVTGASTKQPVQRINKFVTSCRWIVASARLVTLATEPVIAECVVTAVETSLVICATAVDSVETAIEAI